MWSKFTPVGCFPILAVSARGLSPFGPHIPQSILLELSEAVHLNAPALSDITRNQPHKLPRVLDQSTLPSMSVSRFATQYGCGQEKSFFDVPLHLWRLHRHPISQFLQSSFCVSFYHKYPIPTVTIWDFHLFFQTGHSPPSTQVSTGSKHESIWNLSLAKDRSCFTPHVIMERFLSFSFFSHISPLIFKNLFSEGS